MTRYEIDALFSLPLFVTIEIVAAKITVCKLAQGTSIASPETPDVVAKPSIPFFPAIADETAHLVKASGIPRFGNYLCSCKQRFGLNIPQNGRIRHHFP